MGEKQPQFEQLLLPHLDAAYNLARWIVKRDQDAQDVVQEAYLRATKGIGGFRGTDARAWLLTIVRNTAYSWMKEYPNDSNMILTDAPIPDAPTGEPAHGSPQEERTRLLYEANTAYTWIQKRDNHSNMIPFDDATHVAPSDKPLPVPSPEERQRHLHEALSRLSVEFREVLVLREIEGWSYKQLASALNVSAATVMSRLSQARRRLRQEVAGIQRKHLHDEL
jgi:RNA polymerase sigma factor (sigma-70 family)